MLIEIETYNESSVHTGDAKNYEATESVFLEKISSDFLSALIIFEGGVSTILERELQLRLTLTVQMNGFSFSWFRVLKLVKFTFPTVFEMKLQVCDSCPLHLSSSFISSRTRIF